MRDHEAGRHVEFIRQLQRLLDEGEFVASYKYSMLMSLAELALEREPAHDGTLSLELREIASRMIEIYWPQVAPFRGSTVLQQNTGKAAVILREVQLARERHGTLAQARRSAEWSRLVTRVRAHVVKMPLMRLQTMGGAVTPFLYEPRIQYGDTIVLEPGVASAFRALSSIVNALLQAAWIRYLHRLPANRVVIGPEGDLAEFLFGCERSAMRALRNPLRDLQGGRCLYCRSDLSEGGDVDHFIPWSKYQRDLGHNLVLAHAGCNRAKSDLIADTPHLESWLRRNQDSRRELIGLFVEHGVMGDEVTSLHVASWAYESAERTRAMAWRRGKETREMDDTWRRVLPAASSPVRD